MGLKVGFEVNVASFRFRLLFIWVELVEHSFKMSLVIFLSSPIETYVLLHISSPVLEKYVCSLDFKVM